MVNNLGESTMCHLSAGLLKRFHSCHSPRHVSSSFPNAIFSTETDPVRHYQVCTYMYVDSRLCLMFFHKHYNFLLPTNEVLDRFTSETEDIKEFMASASRRALAKISKRCVLSCSIGEEVDVDCFLLVPSHWKLGWHVLWPKRNKTKSTWYSEPSRHRHAGCKGK